MKALFIVLLTAIVSYAQPFTFNDIPFLGQTTTAAAFSPSDVANLVMWYKADAIAGKSAGDPVTNWVDSSSSGYILQNTAANQQPYYTNNASEINNKPYLKFDGTDDYLIHGAATVYSQPNTIYAVAKCLAVDGSENSFICDGTNASTRHSIYWYPVSSSTLRIASDTELAALAPHTLTNKFFLFEVTFNNTSSEIMTNGVSNKAGTSGAQALSGFRVASRHASGRYLDGGIAEILVYNANVSSGDRASIRSYFTNKYGAYANW